jgi:hypothetical protein
MLAGHILFLYCHCPATKELAHGPAFSKKEAELRIRKLVSVFSFYNPLSKKKEQLSIRLEKRNSRDDIAIPFSENIELSGNLKTRRWFCFQPH